jgi:hypothetical protein
VSFRGLSPPVRSAPCPRGTIQERPGAKLSFPLNKRAAPRTKELTMAAQPLHIDMQEPGYHPVGSPQPVSLETIAVVEQALSEMLASMRRRALGGDPYLAATLEYESWLRRDH